MFINKANNTVESLTLKQAKVLGMEHLLDGNFLYGLEPTGLVAQGLRALTSPVPISGHFTTENFTQFVNFLIRDTKFIWKRCRPGTPLNKTPKALLDGTVGWKPHDNTETNSDLPLVKRRLQMLYDKSLMDNASLDSTPGACQLSKLRHDDFLFDEVRALQGRYVLQSVRLGTRQQNHPLRFSISLSIVGFIHALDMYVQQSFSFTSDCQKADWPRHKKICHKWNEFPAVPLAKVVHDWLKENLLAIVQETLIVAMRLGISRRDVVLEVDLKSSNNPAILVKSLKVYVEGSGITDWGSSVNVEKLIEGLKDAHSLMTDRNILVLHRSYDTNYGIVRC